MNKFNKHFLWISLKGSKRERERVSDVEQMAMKLASSKAIKIKTNLEKKQRNGKVTRIANETLKQCIFVCKLIRTN